MSKRSALDAGVQQLAEREVKKARVGEGEATFNLDYKLLLLQRGETHEDDYYMLFDPKSTPLYASRIFEAVEAVLRPGVDSDARSFLLDYLCGTETVCTYLQAELDTPVDVAPPVTPRQCQRAQVHRTYLQGRIQELRERLPDWMLPLSRAELGKWETWNDHSPRQVEGPVIYRWFVGWE